MQRTDAIAWTLLDAAGRAVIARDVQWLARYRWFTALVDDLLAERPGKFDG